MTIEPALRGAVLATPLLNRPRLAVAEQVEAADPERAELIRLQVDITSYGPPTQGELRALYERRFRELELLEANGRRWAGPLADHVRGFTFGRGFVEEVDLDAAALLTHAEGALSKEPILALRVRDLRAVDLGELLACPLLERLLALDLRETGLTDDDARRIAAAPSLAGLVWLAVDDNPALSAQGARALAASPHLLGLRWLGLTGTGGDATPRPDTPILRGIIHGWWSPPVQDLVAREIGPRPWMKCDAVWLHNFPPQWWHLVDLGIDVPGHRTRTMTARKVYSAVRAQGTGRASLLVASGSYRGGQRPRRRLGIFALGAPVPRLLLDVWVPLEEVSEVSDRLLAIAQVVEGRWDAMFAMAWSRVWTVGASAFSLWTRSGRALWTEGEALCRAEGHPVGLDRIRAIDVVVSPDWSSFGVRAMLRDGGELALVEEKNPVAALDPTYDWINLDADTEPIRSLARSLASVLGVPLNDGVAGG